MRRSTIIRSAIGSVVVILICVGIYEVGFAGKNSILNSTKFTLSVGKTHTTKSGSTIQLVSAPSDFRCSKNGCAIDGSAVVVVNISGQGYSIPAKLFLSVDSFDADNVEDSIDFGGTTDTAYTLQIIKLTPEPILGKQYKQSDYRATFLLIKK